MKLSQLFSNYSQLRWGQSLESEVKKVTSDSRQVEFGDVFVAVKGLTVDGHNFLSIAADQGAVALVVEDLTKVPEGFGGAVLVVSDSRLAMSEIANKRYGEPGDKMYSVGVTGTNGKTTITNMIEAIFSSFGWSTGVVGTVDHHVGEHKWKTSLTTPEPDVFFKRLSEFVALGAKAFCMEVSSMALDQRRLVGVPFDCVVFSNLTQDHLDYHQTMENYFAAKQKLFSDVIGFSKKKSKFAVINTDDPWGKQISANSNYRLWSYGQKDSDFQFTLLEQSFEFSRVQVKTPSGEAEFHLRSPGLHNVYNAVAALAVGMAAGISLSGCVRGIESFRGVCGRLERMENSRGYNIFVDYAHTGDALEKVLISLNEIRKSGPSRARIITVFGCAGDRDKGKRPLMGRVAEQYSDIMFVTSDNPRSEDPKTIIEEVVGGMSEPTSQSVFQEPDRALAIRRAIREMKTGDILLVAGKGHEDYQQLAGETIHFSDQEQVQKHLEELDD